MSDPQTRRVEAQERLNALIDRLERFEKDDAYSKLCTYVTGSFGRLEAWSGSDLDLFFLYDGHATYEDEFGETRTSLPWMSVIRLFAALSDHAEELDFPPFSGDGKYLEIQYVDDMEQVLGSPDDDSANSFTARMLLLLESRPLLNSELYQRLLERVVGFYFRDFEDYPDDFAPTFLTNDILRFWRTLTLNYEHDRFIDSRVREDQRELAKATSALKNYKLKFSRLSTCFSMVAQLVCSERPVTQDRVVGLCAQTPSERFEALRDAGGDAERIVNEIIAGYEQFLERSQRPKKELIAELQDRDLRRDLLTQAGDFGRLVYELLQAVDSDDRMRHLVV